MEIENTVTETGAEAPVKEHGKEEQSVNLPGDEGKGDNPALKNETQDAPSLSPGLRTEAGGVFTNQAILKNEAQDAPNLSPGIRTDTGGVFIEQFEKEYAEKGALSEESYKALEKAGIGKSVVDTYIEGQKALAFARASEIKNYAGGEAEYAKMTAWAAENLTEAEKAAFNASVNGWDMASARLAVEGLNARYRARAGYIPGARVEGGSSPASAGYASMAEMVRDVQDPRYKNDEAYRKKVAEKAARSRI